MKQFFLLLQDNPSLAAAEVVALAHPTQVAHLGPLLILDSIDTKFHSRLALCHATYEFLFSCHVSALYEAMDAFDWQSHYSKSFKLEVHDANVNIREIAGHIWNKLKKPVVDLEKPKTRFELFFVGNRVVAGRRIREIKGKPFLARRPHLRKANHPSGMQPRIARALVNLTGAMTGTIVDPFCGAGGTLMEAGLMGFKLIGTDIEKEMIVRAKKNLAAMKLKANLKMADATKLKGKIEYVVTDLPYGRNTKGKELPALYLKFLKKLKSSLKKRAVVVFPDFVNHKKLLKQAKLTIIGEFTQYVHATLTRKIVVVEPFATS